MLNDLTKEELLDVLEHYDLYIQDANDGELYDEGWRPVCIEEFYMSDYPILKEASLEEDN